MKTKQEQVIKVGIVYNAFDTTQVERAELVYRKNTKLKNYLHDLPTDCDWQIGLNGQPVTLAEKGDVRLKPNDTIQLVVVPRGGSAKDILRVVALVAVVAAAYALFGPGGAILAGGVWGTAAMTAFVIAGSLLINAVLPPSAMKRDKEESTSYGYDGAKNTIKQGVAVPVVYGQFRVAGNYVDLYSQNVGDVQYLYGRTVLSDGKITSVTEPYLNDQPIANYTDVDWDFSLGGDNEAINPWFNRNIAQVNKGIRLVGGQPYVVHTTEDEVDQIQLNLQFPSGICTVDDKGKKKTRTVNLDIQISPAGANQWTGLNGVRLQTISGDIGGGITPVTTKLGVNVQPNYDSTKLNAPVSYDIQYKKNGDATWTTIKSVQANASQSVQNQSVSDWAIPIAALPNLASYAGASHHEWTVPAGQYSIRVIGATMLSYSYLETTGTQSAFSYSDKTTKALRKTIETGTLPLSKYDIRIRKTSPDGANEYEIDACYLVDVGEITNTGISMSSVANAYYRVKMTEQLSSIPNITWLVKGVQVNKYDAVGNVTVKEWSDNPAWIVLDMLIGSERGSTGVYKIDFPAFLDWAEYCETANLKFNGVFDETTSLWDACVDVLKTGHAAFSRLGTKLSLTVDRPQSPVMLFGPGNIFKETFKVNYLAMTGRANEFEVSYFDREDNNKQKTIRIVDPDANNRGDIPRPVSYNLPGIDNFDQAHREAWYQLYNNRYLRRTISFDAPTESIGLGIGEVALIQHDMMDWGTAGRLTSGSTTTNIKLDKLHLLEVGNDYSALVIHDAVVRSTGNYSATVGRTIQLTGCTNPGVAFDKVKRLRQGSFDTAILDIDWVNDTAFVAVDDPTGFGSGPVQLFDTDVIEERDVVWGNASNQEVNNVNLSAPLSIAPATFSSYMVGIKTIVKKPYRLKGMSGTGFDRRGLTFVEYNPAIFNPPEMIVPQPPTSQPKGVRHVTNLSFTYDIRTTTVSTAVRGILSWNSDDPNYGGVDIYVSTNGSGFVFSKTVANAMECQIDVGMGDDVEIKVVAYSVTGIRAPIGTAPTTRSSIVAGPQLLGRPTALNVVLVSYIALGVVEATWNAPLTETGEDGLTIKYRVQISSDGSTWDEYGVTSETMLRVGDLHAGSYSLRVRTERGESYSAWTYDTFAVGTTSDTVEPGSTVGGTIGENIKNPDGSLYQPGGAGGPVDIQPPDAPTNLLLDSALDDGVGVTLIASWTASVSADTAGYDVQIKEGTGTYISFTTATTNWQYKGLRRNQAYTVKVRAYDRAGNYGAFTPEKTVTTKRDTTPPAKPTGVAATPTYQSAVISFTAPADKDVSYCRVSIYFNNNLAAFRDVTVGPSTVVTTIFTDLAKATIYSVDVEAFDTSGNGSGATAKVSFTTAGGIAASDFVDGLQPITKVDTLPTAAGYVGPSPVYNKADGLLYAYKNGAWKSSTVVDDNSISTSKLQVGSVQAGNIAANAITATKLAIGNPDNIIPDSDLRDPAFWAVVNNATVTNAIVATNSSWPAPVNLLQVTGKGSNFVSNTPFFPVEAGATYRIRMYVYCGSDFSGFFNPIVHMPGLIYYSPKTNTATADPKTSSADSFIAPTQGPVQAFEGVYTNTTDNSLQAAKSWQIMWAGTFTGNVQVFYQINRVSDTTLIANGAITTGKITVGQLNGDRITAGTLDANTIKANSVISNSVTVSGGNSLGNIGTWANDPATRINNLGTTQIDPGRILISGSTSLASWRNGSDSTKIEGGNIAANTISANKLTIGNRGITVQDLNFQANPATNTVTWGGGAIGYVDDNGNGTFTAVSGGSATYSGGYVYISWIKGSGALITTNSLTTAIGEDRISLAIYQGGSYLIVNYGGTIIDGDRITTGSIRAAQIAAGSITADRLSVTSLSAISATIGTLRTATTGARMEIENNQIRGYYDNGNLAFRFGVF